MTPMGARTFTKGSITSQAAADVLRAAEAKAAEMGVPMVIAVVDESGVLKAFSRMDGAPLLSVELATDKAYTSAAYGIPTHGWHEFIKNDPPLLHGIIKTPRLIVFGGGYPIEIDGAVVGGVGVSGGHYEQDMEVAKAGLAALS
ncbi:heme-binding protein [Phenylobacterium sp.]|uniref:GlcG/HbpS family heme-binding protein n=1 Tax=Phenylobacterium sp. TaxID=1871053 RepID=UPI0025D2B720|nr:heme-binding protein [Phenylobacterium sp.]